MDSTTYKFASYNFKNVKSAVNDIRRLCDDCVVIALQETWLAQDELRFLNSIYSRFSSTGTSAVDTSTGLLRGRKYGGTALLWNRNVFPCVTVIDCDNSRVSAIRIETAASPLINGVACVYMPKRWLDHCVVSQSAAVSVCNVYVKYDVVWSDHFPLIWEFELKCLSPITLTFNKSINKVRWRDKSADQISLYSSECHKRLRHIDFNSDFEKCADRYCNNPAHSLLIDKLYSDIVL
ncbi:unnamed protein product, partial [Leptidea sinapis]